MQQMRRSSLSAYTLCGLAMVVLVGTGSGADIWPLRTLAYVGLVGASATAGVVLRHAWTALIPVACAAMWIGIDLATDSALSETAGIHGVLFEPAVVVVGLGLGYVHLVSNAVARSTAAP